MTPAEAQAHAQRTIQQSNAAYKQWCKQWREQAMENGKIPMKHLVDFENSGIGKAVLCIANGYSFEENIETIKLHAENVDIMVCDKTLGHALDHGLRPKYCLVCDANVNYEKYLEPWNDQLGQTILLMNVCANPRWAKEKWKDRYFFVNRDVIDSHVEFMNLAKCPNSIPAGTNVSNAMVVMLTQSDNAGRNNWFGYDKILLIGYDYSWRPDGNYYAFDHDGGGKHNYMRHLYVKTYADSPAFSSGNLGFSADWLEKYVKGYRLPVIQCSKETIMSGLHFGDLAKNMQYKFRTGDGGRVRKMLEANNAAMAQARKLQAALRQIGCDHQWSAYGSI